jgi:hypothetical protein
MRCVPSGFVNSILSQRLFVYRVHKQNFNKGWPIKYLILLLYFSGNELNYGLLVLRADLQQVKTKYFE